MLFEQIINGHVNITKIMDNQESIQRINHIRLFAGSESTFLKTLFIKHVKEGCGRKRF